MKILVIDRDGLAVQFVKSKIGADHDITEEPVKNNAIERLQKDNFDVILFDPAPLSNARPVILGIRRSVRNYPYIVLMSQTMKREEAIKSGANDVMSKPLDLTDVKKKIGNAERLIGLVLRMGDESEDFPSAGGVISKSAFNQLFISCIDRADRYGEESFLVFIGIRNYDELLSVGGPYPAELASAKLSQYLVRLRRQSDIIAQTGKGEYCLMLQRPQYVTEPMEAANRFTEALSGFKDLFESENEQVELYVRLIDIPIGALHIEHIITGNSQATQSSGRG